MAKPRFAVGQEVMWIEAPAGQVTTGCPGDGWVPHITRITKVEDDSSRVAYRVACPDYGGWWVYESQLQEPYKDFEGGVRYRLITKNGGRIVAVDPKFDCWAIVQALRPSTKWSKVSSTGSIIKALAGEEQMTLLRMD